MWQEEAAEAGPEGIREGISGETMAGILDGIQEEALGETAEEIQEEALGEIREAGMPGPAAGDLFSQERMTILWFQTFRLYGKMCGILDAPTMRRYGRIASEAEKAERRESCALEVRTPGRRIPGQRIPGYNLQETRTLVRRIPVRRFQEARIPERRILVRRFLGARPPGGRILGRRIPEVRTRGFRTLEIRQRIQRARMCRK